jgi:DeoR/GlpR family transcriptional regulator of sugar metabolism
VLAAQRRSEIIARLDVREQVTTRETADALGVSESTVRRDLAALAARGLATKVHGGVVRPARPDDRADPASGAASSQDAIAAAAAGTVRPGAAIGLSGGPMIHALARHLAAVPGLTVVTNSLRTADILGRQAPADRRGTVILIGGCRTGADLLAGPLAAVALGTIRLEAVFFDCAGLDRDCGATTTDIADAEARRALARVSARRLVLAEPRQHGVSALSTFLPLDAVDTVVTATAADGGVNDEQRVVLCNARDYILVDAATKSTSGPQSPAAAQSTHPPS